MCISIDETLGNQQKLNNTRFYQIYQTTLKLKYAKQYSKAELCKMKILYYL